MSVWEYQAALPIIFHRTLVALGISDGCAVTRVVIGISGSVALSIRLRKQIAHSIILIGGRITPSICRGQDLSIPIIGIAGGIAVSVYEAGDISVFIVGIAFAGPIGIGDSGDVAIIIVFIIGGIAFTVCLGNPLIQLVVAEFLRTILIGGFNDAAKLVIHDG